MQPGRHHWAAALGTAVALHAGLLLLFWEPRADAGSGGVGGIQVMLGPPGAAAVAEAQPAAPPPDAEMVDLAEASAAAPEIETVTAREPETAPPPEEVEVVEAVEADTVTPSEPVVEETQAREIAPPPKPRPKPKEPPRPQVERRPRPQPPKPVQTRQTAAAPERSAEPSPAAAAPASSTAAQGGTPQAERNVETAQAAFGGGIPGAQANYLARLNAWLERHKEYPRRAQLRRQEGTVLLHFVMDRSGRVLSYRVEKSSGHALLDQEVEAMIERAQPLPAMPDEMNRARLELVVPVRFYLR